MVADSKPKIKDLIPPTLPSPDERKRLREASGLSVQQLAKVVGVTRGTLYLWERGDREPHGERRIAYHAALTELHNIDARGIS